MPDNRDITLSDMGTRLKARRLALGMTQQQFADHVGVSVRQIQKDENSNRIISVIPQWLTMALDISPVYFLDDSETVRQKRPPTPNR